MNECNFEHLELPVGLMDDDGNLHKFVSMREIDGKVEEAMSDAKVRDNLAKVLTVMLSGVVESIEGMNVSKDAIRELSTIDRDFLLVANYLNSFGNDVSFQYTCSCKKDVDITADVGDMEVIYLTSDEPKEVSMELPRGVKDSAGVAHKKMTVKLPTGVVQEKIAPLIQTNPAYATSVLLQMITLKLGTLDTLTLDTFQKMTSKDRSFVAKQLSDKKFGVDFTIRGICPSCGREFETSIPLPSLLGE